MLSKKSLCLFLLLLSFYSLALDPGKPIDQYALSSQFLDDCLPQSSVLSILQGSDGYLWFGTYEGLARFNGVGFTVFSKSNTPQMKNSGIYSLLNDREDSLWIGTPSGLLCRKNGQFSFFEKKDGLSGPFIITLYEDSKGSLWIGTTNGLTRLHNGTFTAFFKEDGLSHNYINALCEDKAGRLWIGTAGGGVCILDKKGITCLNTRDGLPNNYITALCMDSSGNIWIGSRKGLCCKKSDGRLVVYLKKDGLSDNYITALFMDSHGMLWIGTYNGELNRFENKRFSYINLNMERNKKISSICEDLEGSLWVGTYRSGMYQLTDRRFLRYGRSNGLPVNIIRSIYRDELNNSGTWIGTVGGGLINFKKDGSFKTYGKKEGLLSTGVWSIDGSRDGSIWFGTYGGGLHRLKNGKVETFGHSPGEAKDVVRAVLVDSLDNVWVGTDGGGLDVYKNGRLIRSFNTKNGLSDNYIYSICEDFCGMIWVGTFNGCINIIDWDGVVQTLDAGDGLPGEAIWAFYSDPDGTVWIGTNDGGLCRYKKGKVFRFTVRDGLFSDTAFQILEIKGDFWMNCNKGIYKVNKKMLTDFADGKINRIHCVFYGSEDGFKDVEGTGPAQPAGFVSKKGKIWFPTLRGVVVIDPSFSSSNKIAPPVEVERVTINGTSYPPKAKAVVPPGKGDVEFYYAGLSYFLPGKVRFRYKLEGYNRDWIDAGGRRTAFYTNLSPGKYNFRVMACNNDGVWNTAGNSFAFVLQPYFYDTWWFYTLAFITFCYLFYLGVRFRLERHKKRAQELQRQVEEQTRELRDANMRLKELSSLDGLTEIANRRIFEEHLEKEWRRCQRNQVPISLLLIDVDYFKLYNDTYGHQKGDIALKYVAIVLAHSISRSGDMAARYGGEEFAVILGETDGEGAMLIAERIREAVESLGVTHESSKASDFLTISIGCATAIPGKSNTAGGLVHEADTALYKAKGSGRNRVACSLTMKS
ncbi:MAG: diguanylate cyclase [bacterium]|nr:diguanylate cyclase [bacterium]